MIIRRHPAWTRLTHWINAIAFLTLLISGTAILLALPRLFWGETGAITGPALIDLPLPVNTEQTGWGRNLHFASAWVLVLNGITYLVIGLVGGHFARVFVPARDQIAPAHFATEVLDHLHLRPPRGRDALRYGLLQKLSYIAVVFGLLPVMLLTGLTMSPGITAAYPELFTVFGGRQSARTLHFMAGSALVGFLIIHVAETVIAGAGNLMRAMITGRYAVEDER